jgi:translation initiation factor IF-3
VYHPEHGKRILDRIAEQMEGVAKIEAEPKLDNRNMIMVLAPDKRARQAAASREKNQHRNEKPPAETAEVPVPSAEAQIPEESVGTDPVVEAVSEEIASTEEG